MFGNNCGNGIVPVMNVNGYGNGYGNGMWGDGGWWWIWVVMMFWGWGGNGGWGGNNANNTQFTEAALQRGFDQQNVVGKLDRLGDGLCSLGYDQLNQMNGLSNTVQQVGWNLQQTMNTNEMAQMQRDFAAQQQRSDCCCENRVGQMNIINQMDRNNCATNTLLQQLSQQNMMANQQSFQMLSNQLKDAFCDLEMRQLQTENANLRQQVNDANRDNALYANAQYIIGQVSPRTQPAYLTCNPNTGNVFPQAGLDQWGYYQWQMNRGNCCNQNSCCNNNGCCGQF